MSFTEPLDSRSCVLLRLGERRFALAAEQVAELVAPSRIFRFAHRTSQIDGVIPRRVSVSPAARPPPFLARPSHGSHGSGRRQKTRPDE